MVVRRAQKALQNQIKVDPGDPGRGEMQFQHASLPLVRLGRTWLARRADLEALLGAGPVPTPAPAAPAALGAPRRGRRRKSTAGRQGV